MQRTLRETGHLFWLAAGIVGMVPSACHSQPPEDRAARLPEMEWRMDLHEQVSTEGSDRGTAYTVSGRLIRRRGALLFSWLEAPEAQDKGTRVMIGVCDSETGVLRRAFPIGKVLDNHCGAAMVMDRRDRVHVVLGAHHGPFVYRWSDDPENPEAWSPPESLGPADTYPSLVVDKAGTLHLTNREQMGAYGSNWELWYRRKKQDQPWEPPVALAVNPLPGYAHFMQSLSVGASGTLHLTFQFHASETGRGAGGWVRGSVYLRSDDGGDTWFNESRRIEGPVTVETMLPVGGPDGLPEGPGMGISNHVVDEHGHIWLFASFPGHPGGVLWHRDAGGWRRINLTEAFRGVRSGGGGNASLSRSASGRLHLLFPADPAGGPSTWGSVKLELFHAVFDPSGQCLSLKQITPTTPDAANWLPSLERWDWSARDPRADESLWFLYTRGRDWANTPGTGRNQNTGKTDIYLGRINGCGRNQPKAGE